MDPPVVLDMLGLATRGVLTSILWFGDSRGADGLLPTLTQNWPKVGDYEALMEHSSNTYPYRLVNTTSEYTTRISHLFMDPTERDHVLDLYLIDLC
jgi:hypothetical protein